MRNRRTSGLTLIEVLLATVIVVTVGLSLAVFAPQAIRSIAKVHSRSVATSLASTKIEDTKARPYGVIPVTPDGPPNNDYFSASSPIGPCDCSSADFTKNAMSAETITAGQITYTRQTCVNYIQKTILGAWQSFCNTDTAMKQIVVNISWMLGSERQSYTTQSLASPPAQYGTLLYSTGTYRVTICPADGNVPPSCDPAGNLNLVQGAEVAVYNNSYTGENAGVTNLPNPVLIGVPAGTGYTIRVQKPGYFPFYVSPSSVAAYDVYNVTAILRDITRYGSKLAGEASVADHPVISKVVDGYAQPTGNCTSPASGVVGCNNATEALEIYNPTTSTFTVGNVAGPGVLQVQYCNTTTCLIPDFTNPPFTLSSTPLKLFPGSYLLIVGKDFNGGIPWAVVPDVQYNAADPSLQISAQPGGAVGLIP